MAKTTRYEPRATPIPAGQAPGSGAEVIRRARGTSPLVAALLQASRQPRRQQRDTTGRDIGRGIESAAQSIAGAVSKRGDVERQERQITEAREFQTSERKAREAEARSVEESQRAYREEQTELTDRNRFVSKRAVIEMDRVTALNQVKRDQNAVLATKGHKVLETLAQGGTRAVALAEAEGMTLPEYRTKVEQAITDFNVVLRVEDFNNQADMQVKMLEWERRGTAPYTSGEGVSEELPELSDRTLDRAFPEFILDTHQNIMFLDNEQLLTANDVRTGKLKMAVAATAEARDGAQRYRATMIQMGMLTPVDQLDKAEPLVTDLIGVIAKAANNKTEFAMEDVYRAISQTVEDNPQVQEIIRQVLSGEEPLFQKGVSNPTKAGIYESVSGMLTQALEATKGVDMTNRLEDQLSVWGFDADPVETMDKLQAALRTARSRINATNIEEGVEKWRDPKYDHSARAEALASHLAQALTLESGGSELLEGLLEEQKETLAGALQRLQRINNPLPFHDLLWGGQQLSPAAAAKAREGMSPLKARVGAPAQFRSPTGGGQAQPEPATPAPMLQQQQQPQQPPLAPPLAPQSTLDSLIRP